VLDRMGIICYSRIDRKNQTDIRYLTSNTDTDFRRRYIVYWKIPNTDYRHWICYRKFMASQINIYS